jgi:hypothetical protein
MILDSTDVAPEDFERETGWVIKPEGACRAGVCVPLGMAASSVTLDLLAERLGMGLVHDERQGASARRRASTCSPTTRQ